MKSLLSSVLLAVVLPAAFAHAPTGVAAPLTLSVDQGEVLVQKARYVRGLQHNRQPISINTSDVADVAESAWSSASDADKERNKKGEEWTSSKPDSTDYNPETYSGSWPFSIESTFATLLCLLIASAPIVLAAFAEEQLTRTHMLESVALIAWLGGVLYLFTAVLKFQSVHWTGTRPLTIVEAIYLLAQILTTVGYGDITPAFPRGQVWVGMNVIIGLLLYGSIVMEVVDIVSQRIHKMVKERAARQHAERVAAAGAHPSMEQLDTVPIKNWSGLKEIDYQPMLDSAIFFFAMATIGILFWHYKDGEDRTWLQAVYMSVITLSTVGFGAFTPITEAGKVFGALWMLVGVSALAALITSFVDLMMRMKTVQHVNMDAEREKFISLLDISTMKRGGGAMDKTEFLKFALMLQKGIKPADLEKIEARFAALGPDAKGRVTLDRIDQAERPPLN